MALAVADPMRQQSAVQTDTNASSAAPFGPSGFYRRLGGTAFAATSRWKQLEGALKREWRRQLKFSALSMSFAYLTSVKRTWSPQCLHLGNCFPNTQVTSCGTAWSSE